MKKLQYNNQQPIRQSEIESINNMVKTLPANNYINKEENQNIYDEQLDYSPKQNIKEMKFDTNKKTYNYEEKKPLQETQETTQKLTETSTEFIAKQFTNRAIMECIRAAEEIEKRDEYNKNIQFGVDMSMQKFV